MSISLRSTVCQYGHHRLWNPSRFRWFIEGNIFIVILFSRFGIVILFNWSIIAHICVINLGETPSHFNTHCHIVSRTIQSKLHWYLNQDTMIFILKIGYRNNMAAESWWRYQMETFSALLALCVGNSPVTGEFPSKRPVTRSFDVFFDLHLYRRLSKQSRRWWFETPSRPLWRHWNDSTLGARDSTRSANGSRWKLLQISTILPVSTVV